MNKKVYSVIIVLATLPPQLLLSQTKLDQILYRCQYKVETLKDTLNSNYTSEDFMNLDIGDNMAVFYSARKAEKDAYREQTKAQGFDMERIKATPKGVNDYRIYINYPKNKISYKDELVGKRDKYYYEEDFKPMAWRIGSETMKILKYTCQKATCSYMGRDYEAWFTTEIPIKYGPYKFNGLPGLILKLYDTKKHYVFEAVGFEQLKASEHITYDMENFQKVSKNDFLKIQHAFITNPIQFISQSLGVKIEGLSTREARNKEGIRARAYLPIELMKK